MRNLQRATKEHITKDVWSRFWAGIAILTALLTMGTVGYVMLGLSLRDAIYQTVITITTVGYKEVGQVTPTYQTFTIVLILTGTGTVLYVLGVLIETLFESRFDVQIRRRRMYSQIAKLEDHVILCGFGQVGQTIFQEIAGAGAGTVPGTNTRADTGREVVIIDKLDKTDIHHCHAQHMPTDFWVTGEATEDRTLIKAGLQSAKVLILAFSSDVDNLFITLTARAMKHDLLIVTRANESRLEQRLYQAGANHVVNPHRIGGSRMASLVLPTLLSTPPTLETTLTNSRDKH